MGDDLAIALAVFVASSLAVIYFGTRLAVYGDVLADLTGWGRVFVGSLLVALATSLPELSTNVSAVRLDPPNPELAVGTILGANMYNMFKLSLVMLLFGGIGFLRRVAPNQNYLVAASVIITGAALIFAATKLDLALWNVGLSSLVLLVMFVVGMRVVFGYTHRGKPRRRWWDQRTDDPAAGLGVVWHCVIGRGGRRLLPGLERRPNR